MKTMPRPRRLAAAFALVSMFALSANAFAAPTPHVAATKTSIATGAWSNPATWDTGVPVATDDVVIGAGTTVTIDTTPITVNSLTVQGTLQYDATLRAFTVTTDLSIAPGGILQTNTAGAQTGHTLSVGGNLTNDGTLDLSTSANTSGARLTFTGAASNTFSGTGATTDLRTLTINKGVSKANILEITTSALSVQGTVVDGTPMAFLTITNGTLKVSGSFAFAGRIFTAAGYSIPANGGFWLNNPNVTVSGQNGSPTMTGLLRVSQGTYNIGTATGNSMGFGNNAIVTVEGGAINVTGRFGVNAATNNLTYTQTGGVITVCTIGNASSTLASFDLGQGVGPDVVMSGGSVILRINCTGVPARDYRNQQGNTALGITNTVVQFGDAGSGAAKTFNVEGLLPNVVVNNASAGHTVLYRPPFIFNNNARDVTINAGCTYNIGNNAYLESGSTVTNDGTLTANGPFARFIWFQAGGSCTYQGAGVSTGVMTSWETQVANLTMSQVSQLVVRRAIIFTGNVLNSSKLTLGDAGATLNVVQIGNTTTPTAAGAFDVAPTFDLGAGGEHLAYLRTTASRSTGPEVNPGRALVNLSYDDNDVSHTLTIAGGDIAVSGTTALTNGRVVTNANTLVANGVVTRTTGYVDGLLQKPVPVGGPVARTFEVGDALAYSPVDVTFASVAGAGTLTGKATGGDHAQIASSGIDAGKSVNRHWTLTNTGTSFTTADAVFNFVSGDVDGGANFNGFFVRKYDAPNWSAPATGARTATSTQATGITSFSDFAVGELVNYTIVAAAGSGGSIAPSGSVSVGSGNDQTFTITADACNSISDVVVDGNSIGAVASYTFLNVQANHTIAASFSLNTYTIVASAGTGGSIAPSGSVAVNCGSDQAFSITADPSYAIQDVVVDGNSVGAVSSYAFLSVQASHTISVSFVFSGHTINASAGAGGAISPSGAVPVLDGGSQTFTITPDACHTIADVLVDGISQGAVSSYTFSTVTADHTISASFNAIAPTITPVTGVAAAQVKVGNDSDGTSRVQVTFTLPGGAASVEVWRKGFGGYPTYDNAGGAVPSPPGSYPPAGWTLTGVTASGGNDEPSTRDYWYYIAYAVDACGNHSAVSNLSNGSLGYHLGDVSDGVTPGAGNNIVNTADLSLLGMHYGLSGGALAGFEYLDVGPTTDNSPNGRPTTDLKTDFEDLVMFAINYTPVVSVVAKGGTSTQASSAAEMEVRVPESVTSGDVFDVPVDVKSGGLQAISVALAWDATVVEPVEMVPGEGLASHEAIALSPGAGRVDVAVLGAGRSLPDGTIATFRFRALASGEPAVTVGAVVGRNSLNEAVAVKTQKSLAGRAAVTATELLPVSPNPAFGRATIGYALAKAGNVSLAIYSVDGRLVRTLASGTQEAGRHEFDWNGTDERGAAVRAGQYFVRFAAPGIQKTRNVTLVR